MELFERGANYGMNSGACRSISSDSIMRAASGFSEQLDSGSFKADLRADPTIVPIVGGALRIAMGIGGCCSWLSSLFSPLAIPDSQN